MTFSSGKRKRRAVSGLLFWEGYEESVFPPAQVSFRQIRRDPGSGIPSISGFSRCSSSGREEAASDARYGDIP